MGKADHCHFERTNYEMFKIPLHLAHCLTGAHHIQAQLELADIMQQSFRNFTKWQ